MKQTAQGKLILAAIMLAASPVITAPTVLAEDAVGENKYEVGADQKINDQLSYVQSVIIAYNGPEFEKAVETADKAVKRADKKWGEGNVNTGYVLAHQSLAQVNYLTLYNQMPRAQALEWIDVVSQYQDQYGAHIDAASHSILTLMAELSKARVYKAMRNNDVALEHFDKAIAVLTEIEGGHEYMFGIQIERQSAEF